MQLRRMLAGCGIEQISIRQTGALEAARAGRDWVAVAGTTSGKTLYYNLPIWESVLRADSYGSLSPCGQRSG